MCLSICYNANRHKDDNAHDEQTNKKLQRLRLWSFSIPFGIGGLNLRLATV